jgi:hypothetical protein
MLYCEVIGINYYNYTEYMNRLPSVKNLAVYTNITAKNLTFGEEYRVPESFFFVGAG